MAFTALTPKQVVDLVKDSQRYLCHNDELIDIYEGNLMEHLDRDMKAQFSVQMYNQAVIRAVPINILPKVIDKLTNIYQTSVLRKVSDGSKSDENLLNWYEDKLSINDLLNQSNELFNLCKATLIQPYVYNEIPSLRVILNDRFIVYSSDSVDPTNPTDIILLMGKGKNNTDIYYHYTADVFEIIDSEAKIQRDLMLEMDNYDGINPVGKLPFVYVNESPYRIAPKPDSDILKLTKIIPLMLTDLNVAAMYQSFSILYGIDVDDENLKMGPSAFWRFKSDATTNKAPSIGMLKPEVDYDQVLNLIQAELSMWMGTKGISASSVGNIKNGKNLASGISKVIDEMDTYEARQKQVTVYTKAEKTLWDLILKTMNPYWVQNKLIPSQASFSPNAEVSVTFAAQLPMQSRGQVVSDLSAEYNAGFISRRRAMMKLNPELPEAEIDELILEIDAERDALKVDPLLGPLNDAAFSAIPKPVAGVTAPGDAPVQPGSGK